MDRHLHAVPLDAFELLGIETHATEAQIRTAYRKRSLQLHPDKVKDVPPDQAAERFHQLTLAYEELMNPASRAKLQESLQREREKLKRQAAFDVKRRRMTADLERREEQDRLQRMERERQRLARQQRILALREEGRAMRIDKHERLLEAWQQRTSRLNPVSTQALTSTPDSSSTLTELPPWDANDSWVLVRFPTEQAHEMWGSTAAPEPLTSSPLCLALASSYGPLASASVKPSHKQRREISVVVQFLHGVHAWRAVSEGSDLRCSHVLLQDCWIRWCDASGKATSLPPQRVQACLARGITAQDMSVQLSTALTDCGDHFDHDYEARTLKRLRQAAAMHVAA